MYSLTVYDRPHILEETIDDIKRLRGRHPSLIQGQSVQPLKNRIDIILSQELLYKFLCIALDRQCINKDELTWSSLPNLVCHDREGGEQLHHYLHNYLRHSGCRRDLGVNVETIQKAFYRLKQFNDRFQVGNDALERLRYLNVRMVRSSNETRHIQ